MIKAVIFDVDGVLLDSFESNFQFAEKLFREAGFIPPTREEYVTFFHFSLRDTIKAVTHLTDESKIDEIWNRGRSGEFDVIDATLPLGAERVLKQLGQDYLLAIASSRVRSHISEDPLGKLLPYFKATVAYEDTENHKPHPEPLLRAAELLGVRADECVYVGDVENDAVAARAAGMKIIIYSRERVNSADAQTDDFNKIPELIKSV